LPVIPLGASSRAPALYAVEARAPGGREMCPGGMHLWKSRHGFSDGEIDQADIRKVLRHC